MLNITNQGGKIYYIHGSTAPRTWDVEFAKITLIHSYQRIYVLNIKCLTNQDGELESKVANNRRQGVRFSGKTDAGNY